MTESMYQTPQTSDFERNVGAITQKAEAEAHAERLRITSDAVMKGAAQSNRLIIAVIISFEIMYDKTVEDTMQLIRDFVGRGSSTPAELGAIARVQLGSFIDRMLDQLPDAGFPHDAARIRGEYRQKFWQRLDGALRDIQIGSVGGRTIPTATTNEAEVTPSKFSDAVILKPAFMGMGVDLYKISRWALDRWRAIRRR